MQTSSPNLARIPAGDFLMGASDVDEDERPVHRVYVSEFFIGRFAVTNDEYARLVHATGHPAPIVREHPLITPGGREELFRESAAPRLENNEPPAGHGSHPVVLVRYDDAVAYCRWMSETESGPFACRRRPSGRRPRGPERKGSAIRGATRSTRPARTFSPTRPPGTSAARGRRHLRAERLRALRRLRECVGVGRRLVRADYYGLGDMRDPRGPQAGNLRLVRGGSWVNDDVAMLRCAYRHKVPPDTYPTARIQDRMRSLIAVMMLTMAAAASAQPAPPDVIVATGEAVVMRAPDRAFVTVTVETRAKAPRDAQRINAEAMTAVQQRLDQARVPKDAVRTRGYELQQEFDFTNGKRVPREFVARNAIEVRVDEVGRAGELLDVAVQSGATATGGVRFDLRDREGAEREALRLAVADARARAEAAAAGAGRAIDRVIKVEDIRESGSPVPRPMLAMARVADAPATPIEPGLIEIHARVTLTAAMR